MGDIENLHNLQVIDTAIDQLAVRRANLASRAAHRAAEAACDELRRAIAQNVKRRTDLDAQYAALERAGADLDAKVSRLEGQLRTVVVTREAEAIQREIASLRSEREAGDDAGLALLDEAEVLSTASARMGADLGTAEAAEREAAGTLALDDAALEAERAALVQQRQAALGELAADLVTEYEQLRRSFNGVAVARLEGAQCTGCHIVLSRVEVEAVRAVPADGRAECPHCARLLAR